MNTCKISFRLITSTFLFCLFAFCGLPTQAETPAPIPMENMDNCPTASFSIINNGSLAGIPINFANESSGASSYHWDFGDGTFSTDESPSHVYASSGTYTVKLVAHGIGCSAEFIGTEDVIVD